MKFLFNFASRSRPEKMFAALDNIRALAGYANYQVVLTLDVDDKTCNTPEVRDRIKTYSRVTPFWGISKSKVDAINKNVALADDDWDVLINMSDDMVWTKDGFLEEIKNDVDKINASIVFSTEYDFFLHYPDGHVNERLCTMSIMGRTYYDRFDYIYHPDYTSLYCDQEAQDVAKSLGLYCFSNKQLFVHRHPVWGESQMDDQYRHTESFYEQDRQVYEKRKRLNFPI